MTDSTDTRPRERYELVVDSGIRSQADLAAILPADVRDRVADGFNELLGQMTSAAALRVLATIRNPAWRLFVEAHRIDWEAMVNGWARRELATADSVRVRVEAAASLDGWYDAKPDLRYLCRVLDRENFLAVIDAMRIIADGGLEK